MEILSARKAYDSYLELHLSSGSRRLYNDTLDTIVQGLGLQRPAALTIPLVQEYLVEAKKSYKSSTLNNHVRILKCFMNWLTEYGELESNPIAGLKSLPVTEDPKRRSLKEPEVKRLIKGKRGLLWEFFISTGVRKTEFISLLIKDFDWDAGTVNIRPSTVKRHKGRRIPIIANLGQRIRKRCNGAAGNVHVFKNGAGRPWENYLLKALRTDLKRARISSHGVDLHALRYTFATRMIHRGVDPKTVQHLMGHANIELTLKIYVQAQAENSPAVQRALEMPK